ncbi:MAG: hypothetical protein ACRC9V_03665, partial [Aeromonas sp.]
MDSDGLYNSTIENATNVLEAYLKAENVDQFLRDEDMYVPIFPSMVLSCQDFLICDYDLDGVVIELLDLACLNVGLYYLFVAPVTVHNVQNHWHILKKHLPLSEWSERGVKALRNTFGMVLAYVDGGYFLNVSCLPADTQHPETLFGTCLVAKVYAVGLINSVLRLFRAKLVTLSQEDMSRPSVFKADLFNMSKLNIVADDLQFMLALFTTAFNEANVDPGVKMILTLTKFGQKDPKEFNLSSLANPAGVKCATLHVACTLSHDDLDTDLMWSRRGLQDLVGVRGNLFSVLGMKEVANFQSNLDHLQMDMQETLTSPFRVGNGRLNFVQYYSVTPHVHNASPAIHPVSRAIATCGLHIKAHGAMLSNNA